MPAGASQHARERLHTFASGLTWDVRKSDVLHWMLDAEDDSAALGGFEIGPDGRRIDDDDDNVSLSEGEDEAS